MDLSPLSLTPPTASGAPQGSALGKDDFLRLLVAQIGHQNPLNPMDDTQFIAQLAQFSSLEQLFEMNKTLGGLGAAQSAIANAQVAGLVGHEVAARGDGVSVTAAGAVPAAFSLAAPAAQVQLRVRDSGGALVRSIQLGPTAAGPQSVAWDGRADDGSALAPGLYHVEVAATDSQGGSVAVIQRVVGVVTSVSFENGFPELVVGGARVRAADVLEVRPPPAP